MDTKQYKVGTQGTLLNFSSGVLVPGFLLVIKGGHDPGEGKGDFSSTALAASGRESAPAGFWLGGQYGGEGKEKGLRETIKMKPLQEAQRPKFHD